jgi:hypothetical protein
MMEKRGGNSGGSDRDRIVTANRDKDTEVVRGHKGVTAPLWPAAILCDLDAILYLKTTPIDGRQKCSLSPFRPGTAFDAFQSWVARR